MHHSTVCNLTEKRSLRNYGQVITYKGLNDLNTTNLCVLLLFYFKVTSRVVVWIKEFLLGRMQRVRVGGQLSAEVRVTSGVPQ